MIQVEETLLRTPVSEALLGRVGAGINFINERQYDTRKIALDGPYWVANVPLNGLEALEPFPFNVEIFDIAMYNLVAGSGGTTELDVQVTAASGGTFQSIFSTTPKIAASAGNNSYFLKSLGAGAGQTQPVFENSLLDADGRLLVAAGSALRVDLVAKQTGTPENCGIIIYFRPI